jgi:hypothetical protein
MQFVRTAARLARLLRLQPQPPAVLDIDLSTLAPVDADGAEASVPDGTAQLTVEQLTAPAGTDDTQEWRTTNPWRTQPGVRYHL